MSMNQGSVASIVVNMVESPAVIVRHRDAIGSRDRRGKEYQAQDDGFSSWAAPRKDRRQGHNGATTVAVLAASTCCLTTFEPSAPKRDLSLFPRLLANHAWRHHLE